MADPLFFHRISPPFYLGIPPEWFDAIASKAVSRKTEISRRLPKRLPKRQQLCCDRYYIPCRKGAGKDKSSLRLDQNSGLKFSSLKIPHTLQKTK